MSRFQASDGITLAYRIQGRQEGDPLLLLHGFPLSSALWDRVLAPLAAYGPVVTPDLRGFGASDAPAGPYTMERLADDLVELLDTLGIERAWVAGHSMGGYVALALAEKHAHRVAGLGLLHSHPYADTPEQRARRYALGGSIYSDRAVFDETTPRNQIGDPDGRPDLVAAARALVRQAHGRAIVAASVGMALRPDRSAVWRSFAGPTLHVSGSADGIIPPARAAQVQAERPHGLHVELATGHLGMLEDPPALVTALLQWWRPGTHG